MNGIKKAALFLSSLDYTEADQLLSRLDAASAKCLRREIMSLRHHNVSAEESHRLDEEFLLSAGWQPPHSVREHQFAAVNHTAANSAAALTTYSPPKHSSENIRAENYRAEKYKADVFVPPVRSFHFMKNWSVQEVVTAMIDEHPQTIAVVLAHLPQSKMKSVLSALPAELQHDIRKRLDGFEMPEEQIIQEIESALRVRYRNQHRPATHSAMLESFADVEMLSDSALSTLFHSADLTTVMLALIGAEPALIARITKYFSPTEEHEMRRRLKMLTNITPDDIDESRQNILEQYNATL